MVGEWLVVVENGGSTIRTWGLNRQKLDVAGPWHWILRLGSGWVDGC